MTKSYKKITLAIVPKISSILSISGSALILLECFYFDRKRVERVYNRLLCSMALLDILESVWNFASTWPIPKENSQAAAFASGNGAICKAQGFFLQLGLMIPILNACLSFYYLLVIRYSWSEERIRRDVEPWFYVVSTIVGLGTSVTGIFLNLYHSSNLWCWIAESPVGKNYYQFYRYAFYFIPLFCCFVIIVVNMGMLIGTVKRLESASKKYLASSYAEKGRKHYKPLRKQALKQSKNQLSLRNSFKQEATEKQFSQVAFSEAGLEYASRNLMCTNEIASVSLLEIGENIVRTFAREVSLSDMDSILALKRSKKKATLFIQNTDREEVPTTENVLSNSITSDITKSATKGLYVDEESSRKVTDMKQGCIRSLRDMIASFVNSVSSRKQVKKKSKSQQVIEQALLYVLSFILTFAWSFANRLILLSGKETPFFIQLGNAFFDPLQGFINYFVYIRPKLLRLRKKHPNISLFQSIKVVVTHSDMATDEGKEVEDGAKREISEWRSINCKTEPIEIETI